MAHLSPSLFLVLAFALGHVNSGYVITTPRRWTINAKSQVCVSLTEGAFTPPGDHLKFILKDVKKKVTHKEEDLVLPAGETNHCADIAVPYTDERRVNLALSGSLGGETLDESVNLTFVGEAGRTFVQTDKYLYKPGQKVEMRILSVNGPDLNVVTDTYEEIYIRNPERTMIAQWLNVSNAAGLVHLEFDLHNDIDEGRYTVGAKFPEKRSEEARFRVEDYVLPRFEVTLEPTQPVMGNDTSVTVTLCAKYTFGEPVRGNATVSLAAGSWKIYANLTESKHITGCENFTFPTDKLLFDHNNCHIRISTLKAQAIVEEDGTKVKIDGANNNIRVNRKAITFRDVSATWVQKPYLPTQVKFATTFPDGKPATTEVMETCMQYNDEQVCKNFTTCNKGYLTFVMPSQSDSRVSIRAVNYPRIERNWNDVMEESRHYKYRYSTDEYIDPTNSSLTIFLSDKINCTTGQNISFTIPVIYIVNGQQSADIHVQVMSRGQVVALKTMPVSFTGGELPFKTEEQIIPLEVVPEGVVRGVFDVPMELPATVSPKIFVLVWYSTSDGNVVADTREVPISECLPHKVDFAFSTAKAEPGEQAHLVLSGANDALCSIGVVDKSVELLSSQNSHLDIQSILQVSSNSEVGHWDQDQLNLEFCLKKYNSSSGAGGALTDTPPSTLTSFGIDFNPYRMSEAIHMFKDAGYFVISNLILEKLFCGDLIIEDLKHKASALGVPEDSMLDSDRPSISTMSGGAGITGGVAFDKAPVAHFAARPPAPESIAEREKVVTIAEQSQDKTQERNYLPETWLWLLKPLSATGELNEPVTLPHTITEWVGRAVCVHPTEGVGISAASSVVTFTPFFTDITLPSTAKRGEVLPVTVSVFNYLDQDLPVKLTLEASENFELVEGETNVQELCVPSKKKVVQSVKVLLTKIADVNITVEAVTDASIVCGDATAITPQKSDRLVRSLKVEPEGYPRESVQVQYVCGEDVASPDVPFATWSLAAPTDVVEGSQRAAITAMGDLMGPTVQNIDHLIGLPSGCGEQNMVRFAPNIFVLQYLEESKQITPALKTRLTRTLRHGYYRQLNFRHSNGSFSAFGTKDKEGSTWLTAFVVKSLSQAAPFTDIDQKTLTESADWLKSLQNETTGCFESRGRVINKMLQGGLKGSAGSEALLATYVLAALLEKGSVPENVTSAAVSCIEGDTSEHPYSLALKAYTLALANQTQQAQALIDTLLAAAVSNSSDMRWNLPDRRGQNTALHVETAAYALLALITHDYETNSESAKKIVRWISGLRNGQGGFISTQDTIVALQALAAFERVQPRGVLDMSVTASATDLAYTFAITEPNRFLEQRVDAPPLPTTVELKASGKGCALIQAVTKYNVLADSQSDAFSLHVNTSVDTVKSADCRTHLLTACASYTLSDGASNMAIIEVKLMSGYLPLKQDLKDLVKGGTGVFKRYEVDGPKVFFYLEEIDAEGVCATFRAYQEVVIEKVKPGSVSVYDYYQPELISTQKFTFNATSCLTP